MNSVSRAKATIEELKKLFSKGRKPSEDDFARLIDTLNDEAGFESVYTREEVDNLLASLKSANEEDILESMAIIEEKIALKADAEHQHVEYIKCNNSLSQDDIHSILGIFTGLRTVEEIIKSK